MFNFMVLKSDPLGNYQVLKHLDCFNPAEAFKHLPFRHFEVLAFDLNLLVDRPFRFVTIKNLVFQYKLITNY